MSPRSGWRDGVLAALIGGSAAWLLEWPAVVSAGVGAALVPLVALAARSVTAIRPGAGPGVCDCGHPLSMHCGSDGAGACAEAGCQCAGRASLAETQ
jgi:hypothetical protein